MLELEIPLLSYGIESRFLICREIFEFLSKFGFYTSNRVNECTPIYRVILILYCVNTD